MKQFWVPSCNQTITEGFSRVSDFNESQVTHNWEPESSQLLNNQVT
jgi:hypothetical protein